jgi:hypothetical protein
LPESPAIIAAPSWKKQKYFGQKMSRATGGCNNFSGQVETRLRQSRSLSSLAVRAGMWSVFMFALLRNVLWLPLAFVAAAAGCKTAAERRGEYVDPNTTLVEGVRPKGDEKNVLGWDARSREIERSLGY